jgi:hypothetical protein
VMLIFSMGPVYFVRDNDSGLSGDLEPPGYSAVIDSWDLPQRRVTPGVVNSKYIVSFEWAAPGRTTPLDCSGYEPQGSPRPTRFDWDLPQMETGSDNV